MNYSAKTYVFSQEQIRTGNTADFLNRFDPAKIPSHELAGMCGALRIRIEGAQEVHEVYADPRSRKFFQRLHAKFPYWGYFLKLHPIRSSKASPALIDAGVFVAIALCHTDFLEARWDRHHAQVLVFDTRRFKRFLTQNDRRLAECGKRAGLTPLAIEHRRKVVAKTVRSFFHLGEFLTRTGYL
jgi:hypothetical protein